MMSGGQPIDPNLAQALQSISSSTEDQQNLKAQLAQAQALRAQPLDMNAGKVVGRISPFAGLAQAGQNMISASQTKQVLNQMKENATQLRNARGQIISKEMANANAMSNPSQNHPDTNAALGVSPINAAQVSPNAATPGTTTDFQ